MTSATGHHFPSGQSNAPVAVDGGLELSIVIPVYRSESILPKLIAKVEEVMRSLRLSERFELILVNDASPDNSWKVISEQAQTRPYIKGVSLRKNFGQHNAVMAGMHHASGRFVILMDDDLQHPPTAIGQLLDALRSGYDVCYTNYVGRQHALWKKAGSKFNDLVATYALRKPKGLYLSSFKALRLEVVKEVIRYEGPYAYVDGLILDVTNSITTIDIEHQPRAEGEGNYNLRRSLSLWLKMLTSFSILPLRFATAVGFCMSVFSLIMIVVITIQKFVHPEYPRGWASLIAAIFLVGGIQTLCLGMIGEYLGRTYLKVNRKPQFVVARTTFKSPPDSAST
ncbi:glycosyltransferase family 2 protein [Achromobacter sp. ACRQX]|uniref:glycosyltransferase family 2 protein n=1 Tax=Achromobacter sp. ACRQX TaxID=2918181 RepID=UPI001EF1A51C|nr:glycosyltransferase family 2 protein [Achromobacter sp. ACRQX]MCG7328549.1 glycosyltransferase family 2 protein [Achromobacter sp. ACRQX]